MPDRFERLQAVAQEHGQGHIFQYWDILTNGARDALLDQVAQIDFPVMRRLIAQWVLATPPEEHFTAIEPVPMIPHGNVAHPEHAEAWAAGEAALRRGEVGLFLVAGGQGTRLGFDGPKGAFPIGPVSGKTLFDYHAAKIHNLQGRYGCELPWYIMVSDTNDAETRAFFEDKGYFGLNPDQIQFLRQRMAPCVDEQGRFMLEAPGVLAMNPNGHGGSIPAMVENGVLDDARRRGVRYLSYFQVDNWAVKVADPLFIGYHALRNAEMSSKNHAKNQPREAVGVHCLCDGEYRVIEYSELDIYPQLLETLPSGELKHRAGNPAIHILSVDFVQRVYDHFDDFPWHLAHKRIPCIGEDGEMVRPDKPNGYKFETFVFDALRLIKHAPLALEIERRFEYTPIKQMEGDNSVAAARQNMSDWWAEWIQASGGTVATNAQGRCAVNLEIDPAHALTQEEFLQKNDGKRWEIAEDTAIVG